jgi:hypothetical protein
MKGTGSGFGYNGEMTSDADDLSGLL